MKKFMLCRKRNIRMLTKSFAIIHHVMELMESLFTLNNLNDDCKTVMPRLFIWKKLSLKELTDSWRRRLNPLQVLRLRQKMLSHNRDKPGIGAPRSWFSVELLWIRWRVAVRFFDEHRQVLCDCCLLSNILGRPRRHSRNCHLENPQLSDERMLYSKRVSLFTHK